MRWSYTLFVAAMVASTLGCSEEDVDSTSIRTSGMSAEVEIVSQGSDVKVHVDLRVGDHDRSNVVVNLTGGDELVAEAEGDRITLSGHDGDYSATFREVGAAETEFAIEFLRTDADESALDTRVTLPEGFTLSGIEPGATVLRSETTTVSWDPPGSSDTMRWRLDGTEVGCIGEEHGTMSDNGRLSLTGGNYDVWPGDEDETCEVELTIERERAGRLDPAFGEGGSVVAIQRRSIRFVSAP